MIKGVLFGAKIDLPFLSLRLPGLETLGGLNGHFARFGNNLFYGLYVAYLPSGKGASIHFALPVVVLIRYLFVLLLFGAIALLINCFRTTSAQTREFIGNYNKTPGTIDTAFYQWIAVVGGYRIPNNDGFM